MYASALAAGLADRQLAGPEWDTPYFSMLSDQDLAMSKYWEEAAAGRFELAPA